MYVIRIRWPREQLPSMAWLQPVLDAQVARTFIPPLYEAVGRYRVAAAPELDVRNVPQPSFAWVSYVSGQVVARTTLPPVPDPYPTSERVALDVRSIPQPAFSWVDAVVDADVAKKILPVVAAELRSFRVWEGNVLDVARIPQPEPLYHQSQVTPFQWAPIAAELQSYRVWEGPKLDVRNVPQPEPLYHQSQVQSPQWAGIAAELQSFRVWEGPALDVRNVPQPFFNSTAQTPVFRTTQIVAEVVIKPHQETGTILPPPPILFNTENILVRLTGPAQAMEVCSGYVGQPPILSQLQEVRAHYTTLLAPRTSALHAVHTPQIGRTEKQGSPVVLNPKNSWFHLRQTDRYHRVCLKCTGDTEVVGLTWMLREAGIR